MRKITLNDLRERLSLVELIGHDNLKREGPRYYRHREHSSLVVDARTGRWHWNARGRHGDILDWCGYQQFGDAWNARDPGMFREVANEIAGRTGLAHDGHLPASRPAPPIDPGAWLLGRGVREETARRFGIAAYQGGVSYPVFQDGQEIARRWKHYDSAAKPKYRWLRHSREAHIYNLDAMADDGLVVAGEPDVWICAQAGIPACSFLYGEGAAPSQEAIALLRRRGITRARVVYDFDDAGQVGARATATALRAGGIAAVVHQLPESVGDKGDLTDLYRRCGFDDRSFHDAVLALPVVTDAIPDSRSPKESGIGNYAADEVGVVRVWERSEPAPRRFAVEGLVPDGMITSLYGDGGQGKSYLALALATHAALGRPFAGLAVERRAALYLDAELDEDEFVRRAYKVARGLGLARPPEGLHYWRLPGPLSDPVVQAEAGRLVRGCGATLVVLDSLTIAAYGADPSAAQDVIAVMKAIEAWGAAVIAIDHSAKPAPGANLSQYRQFGSAFKGYLSRSVVQVTRAEGGGVTLRQTKSNFGALAAPLHLALEFAPDRLTIVPIAGDDERLAGAETHLPPGERVARALAERVGGATPAQLAEDLGMGEKTVRNHLTALKQHGRAQPLGDGRWRGIPDSRSLRDRESGIDPDEGLPEAEEVVEWSA